MKWNKIVVYLLILSFISACSNLKKVKAPQIATFFVGTSTDLPTEGIYTYTLDLSTGASTFKNKKADIINPSFLDISPNQQFLYALERAKGAKENGVKAYHIQEDLSLKLINEQSTKGQGACYLSIGKTGENVMIAHYGSGSVANLPINSDGSLGEVVDLVQHEGSSINKERQEGPHAHFIHQGIGDLVYAADLGIDKVQLYQLENGRLVPNQPSYFSSLKGAGPRHLDFHPKGKFIYLMNEMGGSVSVFAYDKKASTFELQQTISSLPADFNQFNKSADIHVHPSGKFLYASNRGDYDSIAAFKIDEESGQLSLIEIEDESIIWPRNFAISPDGKYLLCANLRDDSISLFSINQQTGVLDFTGQKIAVPKPLCIKFLN